MPEKKVPCPQCGQPKQKRAQLCKQCEGLRRRKPLGKCVICGEPCSSIKAKTCGQEHAKELIKRTKLKTIKYGVDSWAWRGGRRLLKAVGHWYVLIPHGHPARTKNHIYMPEGRWVMEQHLGRYLKATERVYHKNGDKADNNIDNLEIKNYGGHDKDWLGYLYNRCPVCGSRKLKKSAHCRKCAAALRWTDG